MLLYTDIVSKALNREALPLFKKFVDEALTRAYGTDWYDAFGKDILSNSKDFARISKMIDEEHKKPLDCMDITALFFLLTPYIVENDQPLYLEGALPILASYANLDDWQSKRLDRIRMIRNNVSHDKCDADFSANEAALKSGEQEKKWLTEIEEILKFFEPNKSLFEYQKQLSDEVTRELSTKKVQYVTPPHITEAQDIRKELNRIMRLDYCNAPLREPLNGAAPWASATDDLNDLPWPTQAFAAKREEEAKKQLENAPLLTQWQARRGGGTNSSTAANAKTNANPSANTGTNTNRTSPASTEQMVNDTVDKISQGIDKGVNKLFNWFNKRK